MSSGQRKIGKVVSITHTDLDGYFSGYIVREVFSKAEEFVQFNVGYHELTDKLHEVFQINNNVRTHQGELVITDLNLKEEDAQIIVNNSAIFSRITIIDHHYNSPVVVKLLSETDNCTFVHSKGVSATKLAFDYFTNTEGHFSKKGEHLSDYVKQVNAWDVHDFSDMAIFKRGQVLNDVFNDVMDNYREWTPDYVKNKVFNWIIKNWIHDVSIYKHTLSLFEFELKENVLNKFNPTEIFTDIDIEEVIDIKYEDFVYKVSNIEGMSHKQGLAAMAACIAMLTNELGDLGFSFVDCKEYRYAIKSERLPFPLLHHLLYTFDAIDGIFMINQPKGNFPGKVEIRQCSLRPGIDMSQIARVFGGGGHYNAAGFPYPKDIALDTLENKITVNVVTYIQKVGLLIEE